LIGGFCADGGFFCGDLVSCAVIFAIKTAVEISETKQVFCC
jgi:hypothetical protein